MAGLKKMFRIRNQRNDKNSGRVRSAVGPFSPTVALPLSALLGFTLIACEASNARVNAGDQSTEGSERSIYDEVSLAGPVVNSCNAAELLTPTLRKFSFYPNEAPVTKEDFRLPMWLSNLAYKNERGVRSRIQTLSETSVRLFDVKFYNSFQPLNGELNDAQAFLAQSDEARFLVFRGSLGAGDWVNNFDLKPTDAPAELGGKGKVHAGFLKQFQSVWSQIESDLKNTPAHLQKAPLWITGHSLGGALALLYGHALKIDGDHNVGKIVTISQPRVGNQEFMDEVARSLGDDFVRLTHESDPVSLTPASRYAAVQAAPLMRFLGRPGHPAPTAQDFEEWNYVHGGRLFMLNSKREVTENPMWTDEKERSFYFGLLNDPKSRSSLSKVVGVTEHVPTRINCLLQGE